MDQPQPAAVPAPLSFQRRTALSSFALGASAFWSNWVHAETLSPTRKATAKSVILIFNAGAPSHIDLWDPKPEAASNVRGEFQTIDTATPGIQISEIIPALARHSDKLAIIRSLYHRQSSHNAGMYWSIVGRPYRIDSTLINPSRGDYPSFGTLVGWLARRDGYSRALPPYVITPFPHCDSFQYITPGQYGGCLGPKHDPFVLNTDPNKRDFILPNIGLDKKVPADRFDSRRELLSQLDLHPPTLEPSHLKNLDTIRDQALSLVTSAEMRQAFDLSQEPDEVRNRYGRHPWGQSHLLARRLVEAGVKFVSTVNGPSINWDTHQDNFKNLKNRLVPPMEAAFAALLEDLAQRGLLDSTLVVWMGDFGRTPVINATAGRDHWPGCYSMVLAGGGVRGGQVIGQSDKTASSPLSRPLTPADVHASVFAALGYDSNSINYHTADGRPTPLSEGSPISELF